MVSREFLLVTLYCLVSFASAGSEKCRAIAFGGVGDQGPYQVGVLKGLIESLPAAET
jgi:hypothetical protein